MPNEKNIIEYALHAYDTFWEYYKKHWMKEITY